MKHVSDSMARDIQDIETRVSTLITKYPPVLHMIANQVGFNIPQNPSDFARFCATQVTPEKEIILLKALRSQERIAEHMCFRAKYHRKHYTAAKTSKSRDIESIRYTNPDRYVATVTRIGSLSEAQAYS